MAFFADFIVALDAGNHLIPHMPIFQIGLLNGLQMSSKGLQNSLHYAIYIKEAFMNYLVDVFDAGIHLIPHMPDLQ